MPSILCVLSSLADISFYIMWFASNFLLLGVLDSQVSAGDYGSKQFMLKRNGTALK